jgi:hypothetical protein
MTLTLKRINLCSNCYVTNHRQATYCACKSYFNLRLRDGAMTCNWPLVIVNHNTLAINSRRATGNGRTRAGQRALAKARVATETDIESAAASDTGRAADLDSAPE